MSVWFWFGVWFALSVVVGFYLAEMIRLSKWCDEKDLEKRYDQ